MNKPRLLVCSSTFPIAPGDSEPPFVYELCQRLAQWFDVLVLVPAPPGLPGGVTRMGRLRVCRYRYAPRRWQRLAYGGGMLPAIRRAPWLLLLLPMMLLAQLFVLAGLLRRWPAPLVHAHWLFPQGLCAALALATLPAASRPLLKLTSHGGDLFGLRGRLWDTLLAWVLRRSSALAVVSTAMAEHAQQRFALAELPWVCSMGVDTTSRFTPPVADLTREGLLFVGRLAEKKGLDTLLHALALLQQHHGLRPGLVIVGDGPERPVLQSLANQLGVSGQLRWHGRRPNAELVDFYRRAALVVMPSRVASDGDQEGLGLVAVEAMACGALVLASDLPALRDVICPGENGLTFAAGDATALAFALQQALALQLSCQVRLQQAAVQTASRFDWTRVANDYKYWLLGAQRQQGRLEADRD
ncbi:glycosyltransferase [Chitinolyticbacter meiyuanensis]|uniref:glycosyltransferase n=1 Tax=Chitinolyticbacter meiyuanensis TaxID=682798 RepID=UPI0011E5A7D2|nr:glycosyltransferase [Chitinolyticbacter meiyuanensis]